MKPQEMKMIALLVSGVLAMAACSQGEKQVIEIQPTEKEPAVIEVKPAINPEQIATVRMQLAQLVDPPSILRRKTSNLPHGKRTR